MKNFKLLLATTAILSAGALMVYAAPGDETVVPVRAEVVHVHNLHATPIDFGRIGVDDGVFNGNDYLEVSIDSAGIETYNESSPIPGYILSNGKKGSVTGTSCEDLQFLTGVEMSVPNNSIPVGANAEIKCIDVDGTATFYGDFRVDMIEAAEQVPAGNYTGSLTVTEINPEP